MKKWQIENSALQPKSKTRIWNSWKKISREFRDFDPVDLTQNKGIPKY